MPEDETPAEVDPLQPAIDALDTAFEAVRHELSLALAGRPVARDGAKREYLGAIGHAMSSLEKVHRLLSDCVYSAGRRD